MQIISFYTVPETGENIEDRVSYAGSIDSSSSSILCDQFPVVLLDVLCKLPQYNPNGDRVKVFMTDIPETHITQIRTMFDLYSRSENVPVEYEELARP